MPFLLALLAPLGLFALYVASRPGAFRIERSLTIPASPEVLFGLINDFHEWARWSPWEKLDATMTKTFEGPASGKGSTYRWKGNNKVGEGAMTILDSTPSKIEIALAFLKPFAANNRTTFTLDPDGAGTRVTWAMEGENAFMAKAFGVFMNMDELVGKDFASGLASLGEAAAKRSVITPA